MTLQDFSFRAGEPTPVVPDDAMWFLAQARPNQHDRARLNLERQGYPCFAPMRPLTRRRGSRLVAGTEPLFPGYLFLRIAPDQAWRPVKSTFGVAGLVMRGLHQPQPVPPDVMRDLFSRTDATGLLRAPDALSPGDQVKIAVGPMADFIASVEKLDGAGRVGLLLEMMGQTVRVTIPLAHLTPVAK